MEIPVFHEVTRGAQASAAKQKKPTESVTGVSKISINSSVSPASFTTTSGSSTNHVINPPVASPRRRSDEARDNSNVTMHREGVLVTRNKPKTPVKPVLTKTDHITVKSSQPSQHIRLPSTDSGIQADGGCDSLSRYKGQNFLSASSTNDSVFSDPDSSSVTRAGSSAGSGYNSDLSQSSHPSSLSSRLVTLPSQSFLASSKPVTSMTSASSQLTSSVSKSTSAGSTPRTAMSVPASGTPKSGETPSTANSTRKNPVPFRAMSGQSDPVSNSGSKIQRPPPRFSTTTTAQSQNTNSSNTTQANHRPENNPSSANQRGMPKIPTASPRTSNNSTHIKVSPNIKVETTDGGVKVSFSKSTISISSSNAPASSSQSSSSSAPRNAPSSHADVSRTVSHTVNDSTKDGATTTFKFQVFNRQGQQDNVKNQGQGCIALTRPLRLTTPSKVSLRPVAPITHSSQTSKFVSSVNTTQQQQQQQPQKQKVSSSAVIKPKIAPRPSLVAKTGSLQSAKPTASTTSNVTTSTTTTTTKFTVATTANAGTTASTTASVTTTPRIVTSVVQPETASNHNTNTPVVTNRVTSTAAGRKEIPVTHVVNRTAGKSPTSENPPVRPSSFIKTSSSRYTPERDKPRLRHTPQREQNKLPMFEHLHFDIKDGFSFDDNDTRMKHAELILKHSDELINDALKMLNASPITPSDATTNGFSHSAGKFPDDERIVEGADATVISEKEHTVPVFDVRSGKYNTSFRKTEVKVTSSSEGGKRDDWKERKERIDSALSWLKTELAGLRDMDNTLISQFRRCQDTIETLKSQREIWEGLSEEGEDGEYWDDFELNEFNRRYLDSPGGSSCSQISPGSRDNSLHDVTSLTLPVPQLHLPQDRKPNGHHSNGVKQDVEVTL